MENKPRPAQDSQVMRVILFASAIIVFSIVLVSSVVYLLTEKAAVNNLKSKDLVNIAESIASKIEGRVERAKETSLLLAKDPEVIQWVVSGEKDLEAGKHSLEKISRLINDLHYSNSFIVSSVTNHYWTEQGEQIDTMSKSDPDDEWFFSTLNSGQEVSLVIDYNQERRDTFVFVNALMGRVERPLAITGVGLSLKDVAKDLGDYKYGENSDLWLIDQQGNIYLSDNLNQNGKNIKEFIPQSVASQIIQEVPGNKAVSSLEYKNPQGELLDLISYPLQSTNWCLLFQIPRRESLSFLYTLKLNTLLAGFISLVAITFLFNFVSRNLANPYKRALELNQELENKVVERTKELFEKNQKLMDSIDYARRIQQSILPSQDKMSALYKDYFLLRAIYMWVMSYCPHTRSYCASTKSY